MEEQKLGNRSILGERQGPWLTRSITEALTHSLSTENSGAGAECCHATSQDESCLEFVAAATARECNIQDARGGGL